MENLAPQAPSRTILVHHAAQQLGCSDRTVRRHIQQGRIPARRKGRRAWTIDSSDLDRLRARRPSW
jgi:excisionase family DNA binding protein